ncbi:MAG: NAD(P)-dependent glycerol-3-phosphate dehydrogenase [Alphaproteobacteria bacterium]|nr:NAD(P)-dependent glycerol-3-phosphate dehydrogenase [Alphaproteobacteria bacterium]
MAAYQSVSVIGAGAYGTAIAMVAVRAGREVTLFVRNSEQLSQIAASGENPRLPGVKLAETIRLSNDLAEAARSDLILIATPAQQMRNAVTLLAPHLRGPVPLVACAKGIERGTHHFMTEVIAQSAPLALPAILSGPSFADDIARGLPTAMTLAASDDGFAAVIAEALGSPTFRPYHSGDVRGVEIGGAVKNVLAIAIGVTAGRRFGASACAALTTRGFTELARFGRSFGAREETLMGLSGLGDLILTCSSLQSRNFTLGVAMGQGLEPPAGKLAEGVFTAPVLVELAASRGVEMPVAEAVAEVLGGRMTIDGAIGALLSRPFKAEA